MKSVLFLGAGKPANNEPPFGLNLTSKKTTIMDWLLSLFPKGSYKRLFAGGYEIEKFRHKYQDLKIYENEFWKETSPTSSLFLLINNLKKGVIVSYTDILFRKSLVKRFENKSNEFDVVIAVDSNWRLRFNRVSKNDLEQSEFVSCVGKNVESLHFSYQKFLSTDEFCGVFCLSTNAVNFLNELSLEKKSWFSSLPLIEILEHLRISGFTFSFIDVEGDWAELNDPRDISRFLLGTKAETLDRLKTLTKNSIIFDQISFCVKDWINTPSKVIKKIQSKYPSQKVIVRSSSKNEDTFGNSLAGVHESKLNVSTSKNLLSKAINEVINSFKNRNLDDQVLIQEMAQDIISAGVLFTRGLLDGSPYYTINFESVSGKTDGVTSGKTKNSRVIKLFRGSPYKYGVPNWLTPLIKAIVEIEEILHNDTLDIEFAINSSKEVFIFQVRPLKIESAYSKENDDQLVISLKNLETKVSNLLDKNPNLLGKNNILGSMPDWNPAEIIGNHPGRLAFDLYDYLVTSETWAIQRHEYGYRDTRPNSLMIELLGQPYIDCRVSFNSFIPKKINEKLASKLVDHYLNTLKNNPEFHDKIEFNVVPTCFNLNFLKWQNQLSYSGFSKKEIIKLKVSLHEITKNAINKYPKSFDALEHLEKTRKKILQSNSSIIIKIQSLLKITKNFGVLPFAHFARDAFIAADLLNSGIELNLLSNDGYNSFMYSLFTVTSEYTNDVKLFFENKIFKDELIKKYGHLRPNTYNILSKRYDQDYDFYLNPSQHIFKNKKPEHIYAWSQEKDIFLNEIVKVGLSKTKLDAEIFLKSAIENREKAKFIFSRALSDILELIKDYSKNLGISIETISETPLNSILITENLTKKEAYNFISTSANLFRFNKYGQLPELILKTKDIFSFELLQNSGNYIGKKSVSGEKAYYNKSSDVDFKGKIVLIENADPGYDWLFGKNILGLITKYGGANSHMAIRCAEFGVPALIGAGENLFETLIQGKKISLDCQNRNCKLIL